MFHSYFIFAFHCNLFHSHAKPPISSLSRSLFGWCLKQQQQQQQQQFFFNKNDNHYKKKKDQKRERNKEKEEVVEKEEEGEGVEEVD